MPPRRSAPSVRRSVSARLRRRPYGCRSTAQDRQRAQLSQMIWSVPEIIAGLSSYIELQAGDLIYTGTPDGVGPLEPATTCAPASKAWRSWSSGSRPSAVRDSMRRREVQLRHSHAVAPQEGQLSEAMRQVAAPGQRDIGDQQAVLGRPFAGGIQILSFDERQPARPRPRPAVAAGLRHSSRHCSADCRD